MSEREEIQVRLLEELHRQFPYWSAPYGILHGLQKLEGRPGYVRTITFGVARLLDAEIEIWSPKRIVINGRGPLTYRVTGTFDSVEAVIEHLWSMPGMQKEVTS